MEQLTPEEAGRRASVIYDRDIRRDAERDQAGEFVAIDVDTGRWSFGTDFIAATEELRAMGSVAPIVPAGRIDIQKIDGPVSRNARPQSGPACRHVRPRSASD